MEEEEVPVNKAGKGVLAAGELGRERASGLERARRRGHQGSEGWLESRSAGCDLDSINFMRESVGRKRLGQGRSCQRPGRCVPKSSSTNLVLPREEDRWGVP